MPESNLIRLAQLSHVGFIISLALAILLSIFHQRKGSPVFLMAALGLCLPFFGIRAWLKQFFPFTDKTESFVTLAFMIAFFVLWYHKKLSRREFSVLLLLSAIWGAAAFIFKNEIRFPTPYLRTIWYPLHVPLSFASYALWFMVGIRSLLRRLKPRNPPLELKSAAFDAALCRNGFIFFTLSMIFGGIWGYLAWGAYFLWDPKVVWSVIVWFFYGNLLHLDKLPRFKNWRDPLFILGIVIILIPFVGTGFFTRSIHKF
ncbi:MAG: cytochrome c biogenesis protein CcsA [Deltaproteobacteria bacterium]|nr:cytochrome c biogenesis protein CcsA [Deltaproteobacteria bacterium]